MRANGAAAVRDTTGGSDRHAGRVRMRAVAEHAVATSAAERHWPLGRWLSWARTANGWTNATYLVHAERGEFALRCSHPGKTEAALAYETAVLDHLAAAGFPSPRVVPTVDGEPFGRIDGALYLVTERLPGVHYDPANPAHLPGAGRALGALHRALEGFCRPAPPDDRPGLDDLAGAGPVLERMGRMAEVLPDRDGQSRLRAACASLGPHFSRVAAGLGAAGLEGGVVHGSFGRSALLYEGDDYSGVLDFDRAGAGPPALDLAFAARIAKTDHHSLDLDGLAALFAAYRSERALPVTGGAAMVLVLEAQRLVRVLAKARSLGAAGPDSVPPARKVEKLRKVAELELGWVEWLEANAGAVAATVGA
ncbi:MAG: phosphotransferase [Acidimicrobiia bacterium]